jgi:hypothetical protein
MNIQKTIAVSLLSGSFFICQSQGMTLASDDFSYADGALVPNGGWANHSGNAGDLLVAGGAAVVQHGSPSEDANLAFGTQSNGVITATFDIRVNDDSIIGDGGGTDFEYFAHFFTAGSFNFRARLDVIAPSAGGDYSMGISSSSSTAEATLVNDFNFGDTVTVALSFDLADGTGSLLVNGEAISGSASGAGQTMDAIGLRQSDSSNNEAVTVDNLVVTTTVPEPSSALFGGLALLGLLRRRR